MSETILSQKNGTPKHFNCQLRKASRFAWGTPFSKCEGVCVVFSECLELCKQEKREYLEKQKRETRRYAS